MLFFFSWFFSHLFFVRFVWFDWFSSCKFIEINNKQLLLCKTEILDGNNMAREHIDIKWIQIFHVQQINQSFTQQKYKRDRKRDKLWVEKKQKFVQNKRKLTSILALEYISNMYFNCEIPRCYTIHKSEMSCSIRFFLKKKKQLNKEKHKITTTTTTTTKCEKKAKSLEWNLSSRFSVIFI